MNPYPFQDETIEFIRPRRHSIVAHQPGLGKTLCAIRGADLPAFVVCPASLILNWRKEIDLWRPEAADQFTVESYSSPKLGRFNPATMARLYNTVIGDEIHYVKSPKAMRSREVCALIAAIGARGKAIALSGTVVPNRPIELWPLLYAMGIYKGTYNSFGKRFADGWLAPWGPEIKSGKGKGKPSKVWDFSGSSNEGKLRELLTPHLIRYTKAQVLPQLPPKTWRVIALDLPTERREKRFDLSSLTKMKEGVAFEALSDVLKLAGQRKLPRSLEYIETVLADEPKVVIFAHHREVIAQIAEKLAPYHPVTVVGGMSRKRKQEAVDTFQSDPRVRVIVGQNQAMGLGWTLTAASHVIIVEGSWVPGELEQMPDRCHRIGQRNNVTVDILVIDGSIDEHMIHRAVGKQGTIDAIVPVTERVPMVGDPSPLEGAEKKVDTSRSRGLHTFQHPTTTEVSRMSAAKITKAIEKIGEGLTELVELAKAASASDEPDAAEDPPASKSGRKKATRKKATSKKKGTRKKATSKKSEGPPMDDVRKACMELVETVDEFGDEEDDGNAVLAELIDAIDEEAEGLLSALEDNGEALTALLKAIKSYLDKNYPEDE